MASADFKAACKVSPDSVTALERSKLSRVNLLTLQLRKSAAVSDRILLRLNHVFGVDPDTDNSPGVQSFTPLAPAEQNLRELFTDAFNLTQPVEMTLSGNMQKADCVRTDWYSNSNKTQQALLSAAARDGIARLKPLQFATFFVELRERRFDPPKPKPDDDSGDIRLRDIGVLT